MQRSRLLPLRMFLAIALLAGCSDGGGPGAPPPSPPPITPPPPPADSWASVKAAVDSAPIANMRLIVGDASGTLLAYEKGAFSGTRPSLIASSSKLIAGIVITRLVEKGVLSYGDHPQDHIPWWTTNPADPRSRITLAHLLSFTSGFNVAPACVSVAAITHEDCVRQIHDGGLQAAPGAEFYYGSAHLHIAGLMAAKATGLGYSELVRREVGAPLGLTVTRVDSPSASNPRVAGGGVSTAAEYAEILRALLAGELVSCVGPFTEDRTQSAVFAHRPAAVASSGDWHYASGAWRECDSSTWTAACADQVLLSSAGAFGWTPWIDFENGYFGLIATEDSTGGVAAVGNGPSVASTRLEQQLQPLIEVALGR